MNGTFLYLTACSVRNTIRVQLRRLRQPRYLVIGLAFVLYVGSMMLGRPRTGAFTAVALTSVRAQAIAIGVATLLLGTAWILPVGAPLRFSNAEIQFLFPAPVTRRQLIGYKLVLMLLGSAFSGAFLTIFVGPTRLVPALFFAAKSAVVVVVMTIHGVGIATYRSRAKEAGERPGGRWRIVAAACLLTPLAGAGLVFVAFSSAAQFAAALPLAALVVGVNALWFVRTDSAFEEAATDAADKMNRAVATGRFFAHRVSATRFSAFRLAPRGPVASAILWKNWLLLGRMSRQALIGGAIMLVFMVVVFVVAAKGDVSADLIGDISLFAVALTALLGPAMLRIDLRHDLAHLALIKTWPVRGATLIRGEVLAPAIALSLAAVVPIVAGSVFAPGLLLVDQATAGGRTMFALSAILVVTGFIVTQLIVQNGIAASFPAWVELKPATGAAAMEMNVRMMIVMYGSLLVTALVVVIPAAAAFAAYVFSSGLLIPSLVFAVLLLAESLAATEIIGRILDRTDLQDVSGVS